MTLPGYRKADILRGLIIYSAGDTAASILLHQFSVYRLAGMMITGGFLYSLEIPAWFRMINEKYSGTGRTLMAILYFNPLWIARHLALISIYSGQANLISPAILDIAVKSFIANLPVAFAANYIIQNKMPLKRRFLSSAVFSSLMAVYYALSGVIFK